MSKRVLITGGAGFIGSHLADELLQNGWKVRVLDCLSRQVHARGNLPYYLDPEVEVIIDDVRKKAVVTQALRDVDSVVHLAAAVGVGQSMYEIAHYTSVNDLGTAKLLEAIAACRIDRLVVASSMSIYGEGSYIGSDQQACEVSQRSLAQLRSGRWEIEDTQGNVLLPIPTPETKVPVATSVYALSKYHQERICLIVGEAYGIETVALRLFNVYGPRQALSNPYTGVIAIFASRYLNGLSPLVYEDGCQRRDFVNVHDVARAFRLALERPGVAGNVFNIGSGQSVTIRAVADELGRVLNCSHLQPMITHEYRSGDIRHCFADITKARQVLGYEPQCTFTQGLTELTAWLEGQEADNRTDEACRELRKKGLLV